MIICPALILLFLSQGCPSTPLLGQQYDPTPSPRSQGRKSTHISEFTDPRTGFNPFLDLEEGQPGEMGRNLEEVTDSLPESDLQLVEGGPEDNAYPRRNWGSSWDVEEDINKQSFLPPPSPASDAGLSPVEANDWGGVLGHPATRGGRRPFIPEMFTPSSIMPDSDLVDDAKVLEDNSQEDLEYDDKNPQMEATSEIRDNTAQPKKLPISKNVMISAVITGISLAMLALLIAICLWRKRLKLSAAQRRTNFSESGEPMVGDKPNVNTSLPKK